MVMNETTSVPTPSGTKEVPGSSTSKAANFWNLLHTEHEFSAEYLKAVLANDEKAVANALGKIGKSPNEVNLSKEEFVAFMRGRTPSGGLEITSFEGYYETESFSGQVFAVLILSVSNRIFWGPARDFFRHNWSKNEVEYQLGSDATVSFPSSAGNVVLSFSRDFDEKEGTVGNGSFTGTLKDLQISGSQAIPPDLDYEGLKASSSSNITTTSNHTPMASLSSNITETSNHSPMASLSSNITEALTESYTNVVNSLTPFSINLTDTSNNLFNNISILGNTTGTDWIHDGAGLNTFSDNTSETNVLGLSEATIQKFYGFLGGVALMLLLWVCKELHYWRLPGLRRIGRAVEGFVVKYREAQKRHMMVADAHFSEKDFEKYRPEIIEVLSDVMLNESDYDTKSIDEIIEQHELKKLAHEKLKQLVTDHLKGQMEKTAKRGIDNIPKDLGELGDSKALLDVDDIANEKAESVMENFGPESAGIESLVKSFVHERAENFHKEKAEEFKKKREDALKAAKSVHEAREKEKEKLKKVQKDYKVKEMTKEEREVHLERAKSLEKEIFDAEVEHKRVRDEADEADRIREASERKRVEHEGHSKKEKEKVEHEKKKHFTRK